MTEQTFLQQIHDHPGDASILLEYLAWLEQTGDSRVPYFRLMMERLETQRQLQEIDQSLVAVSRGIDSGWIDKVFPLVVRSQTVGKWYPRPLPQSRPYVTVGDFVSHNTVVGLIEVLKTYNEVAAYVTGTVAEICVAEGDTVEFNQILVKIDRFPLFIAGG